MCKEDSLICNDSLAYSGVPVSSQCLWKLEGLCRKSGRGATLASFHSDKSTITDNMQPRITWLGFKGMCVIHFSLSHSYKQT